MSHSHSLERLIALTVVAAASLAFTASAVARTPERIRSYLLSPPPINRLIFHRKFTASSDVAPKAQLNRAVFAIYQSNAVMAIVQPLAEAGSTSTTPNFSACFSMFRTNYWWFQPRKNSMFTYVEDRRFDTNRVEPSVAGGLRAAYNAISPAVNLGILGAKPGTIRFDNLEFSFTDLIGREITGTLLATNGVCAGLEFDLPDPRSGRTIRWKANYTIAPFQELPDHISLSIMENDRWMQKSEIQIIDRTLGSSNLNHTHFLSSRYANLDSTKFFTVSNGNVFQETSEGIKRLGFTKPSNIDADMSGRNTLDSAKYVIRTLIGILLIVPFLYALYRTRSSRSINPQQELNKS